MLRLEAVYIRELDRAALRLERHIYAIEPLESTRHSRLFADVEHAWNAKSDAGKLAVGIPKSSFWASDPNGINQVGCVYRAQGFEFDYVGVIYGKDLVHNGGWSGNRKVSHDNVVKMSPGRGVRESGETDLSGPADARNEGCYLFFEDDATREFFLSRVETETASALGRG